jgi:hypothetical protein
VTEAIYAIKNGTHNTIRILRKNLTIKISSRIINLMVIQKFSNARDALRLIASYNSFHSRVIANFVYGHNTDVKITHNAHIITNTIINALHSISMPVSLIRTKIKVIIPKLADNASNSNIVKKVHAHFHNALLMLLLLLLSLK